MTGQWSLQYVRSISTPPSPILSHPIPPISTPFPDPRSFHPKPTYSGSFHLEPTHPTLLRLSSFRGKHFEQIAYVRDLCITFPFFFYNDFLGGESAGYVLLIWDIYLERTVQQLCAGALMIYNPLDFLEHQFENAARGSTALYPMTGQKMVWFCTSFAVF